MKRYINVHKQHVMYYIGCLSLSGYNIVLLRWSPGVSFAVPSLTFVISAAQCWFWQRVGAPFCCEGWALSPSGTFSYYAAKGLFGCRPIGLEWSPCWAAFIADDLPLPNFTSPSSPSSLAVTGLGAPLSSSVLKRRYISLQNEWMNKYTQTCTQINWCMSEAVRYPYWD